MVEKISKKEANYRMSEDANVRCEDCLNYEPEHSDYGYCYFVMGRVSPNGICKLWEPISNIFRDKILGLY